ncbi:MAG: single-stranded DNA-binding protein [Bacteroidales bacterium]|nr:single-stranded DNA-binding protein [Bacteroidales bacterium]MDT8431908.1 single-stranded DNA-binding protein [Bacteroidales bacterium]
MAVNKVILVGNVGKDPETRYLDENTPVCKFPLATSEVYRNRDGEKVEQTEWHNIVLWRGLAKVAEQYVKKGAQLYIEGRIRSRSYDDKDGIKRYITEIVGDNMQMLGRRQDDNQQDGGDQQYGSGSRQSGGSQESAGTQQTGASQQQGTSQQPGAAQQQGTSQQQGAAQQQGASQQPGGTSPSGSSRQSDVSSPGGSGDSGDPHGAAPGNDPDISGPENEQDDLPF